MGDEQREQCTVALSDAFVTGRLPLEEFDRRVERALAAQTEADLDHLTRDLPVSTALVRPAPAPAPARAAMTARTAVGVVAFQIVLILIAQVAGAAFDSASVSHALISLVIWLGGSACCALGLMLTRPQERRPRLSEPDSIN